MTERPNRRAGALIAVALILVGLALGLLMSWPLPEYLTTGVPYTMAAERDERVVGMVHGDHLQYMYHLGQLRLAAEGRAPWFRNTYEFHCDHGFTEVYVYFPTALLYWPLSYVSEAFAFNVIILLSFVGAMIAGYGLARAWGAGHAGAFCAGVVVALFPARLASLYGGHPAGSAFFLFPLAWWGLEKNWQTRRAGWGWLAAVSLILLARLDPHYLFYFVLLLPFWAFWKLAEAGTFARRELDATRSSPLRGQALLDAIPAIVAALIAAGCVHYNQIRAHVIDGFGPELIALAVFFVLVVLAVRWLIARAVDWLGVMDASLRRLWLVVPWFALWLLAFYFLIASTEKPIRLVRACVGMFVLAHVVFLIVAANKKLLRPGKLTPPWRTIVGLWPVFIGLAVAVAYAMYLKTAVFDVTGVRGGRTLHEVRLFSVPFSQLFDRTAGNPAFIGWFLPFFIIVGSAVVLIGSPLLRADRAGRLRLLIAFSLYLLGLALTCGPLLSAYFPLYEVLYRLVPFFNFTRATLKFAIITATFGAIAVALFATHHPAAEKALLFHLSPWIPRRWSSGWIWPIALAAWAFLDSDPVVKTGVSVLPDENPVYTYVAEHSQGAPLLEIPIWPGDSAHSAVYQYWTLRTNVPTINGYSPTVPAGYIEYVSWPLYDVNYGRFGPREAAVCTKLGVRFIVFHEEVFPRKVAEFPATQSLKMLRLNPNVRLVAEDGPMHLFEILDQPAREIEPEQLPFLSRYVPIDYLKKHVGHEIADDDALDGRAWASDGRADQLFYGPFAVLPTGDYVAVFRIKAHADKPTDEIGTLDVYVKRDKTPAPKEPLAARTLTGARWKESNGYQFVEIPFRLDGAQVVETRGRFAGTPGTSLTLNYVFIQSTHTGDTIRLEAEEFFHTPAHLVEDEDASQGYALKPDEPADGDQLVLEERFVLLDKGIYHVTCAICQGPGAYSFTGIVGVRRAGDDAPIREAARVTLTVPERAVYAVSAQMPVTGPDAIDYIEVERLTETID